MWLVSGSFERKLVLSLALAISLGPVAQGLDCFSCSSDKNAPDYYAECARRDPKNVIKCSDDAVGCLFRTESNGQFVKRECAELTYPLCVDDAFDMQLENGKCFTNNNVTKDNWETLKGCDHRERNLEVAEEESIADIIAVGEVADEVPRKGRRAIQGEEAFDIRTDVTSMEVCFCKSNICNSNAIQPKSALSHGGAGVGNVKAGLGLTLAVGTLGLVLGRIQ